MSGVEVGLAERLTPGRAGLPSLEWVEELPGWVVNTPQDAMRLVAPPEPKPRITRSTTLDQSTGGGRPPSLGGRLIPSTDPWGITKNAAGLIHCVP